MDNKFTFISASTLSLAAFAQLFSCTFENYFYPMVMTAQSLSNRVRTEQLDLFRSVVLLVDDEPVGQATLGLRGTSAWCGGFGIIPEYRGKGLAPELLAEFMNQAREAGAKHLTLEVLEKNTPAQKLYAKAGFQHERDLRLLKWQRVSQATVQTQKHTIKPADMAELMSNFHLLHPVSPAWSRDLASLMLIPNLLRLSHIKEGALQGYVLFTEKDGVVRIYDLAAKENTIAENLLTNLQASAKEIQSINEPDDSSLSLAYDRCKFQEFDRQHELKLAL